MAIAAMTGLLAVMDAARQPPVANKLADVIRFGATVLEALVTLARQLLVASLVARDLAQFDFRARDLLDQETALTLDHRHQGTARTAAFVTRSLATMLIVCRERKKKKKNQ